MKKIVLLGDSIRLIGYGKKAAELLSDRFEVWQPEENCRWVDYTYRMLYDFRNEIAGADTIYWNNGHWDICNLHGDGAFTSLENYVAAAVRLAKRMQTIAKRVIFSTTAPVNPKRTAESNEDIDKYNAAAVAALTEIGVEIHDLNAFVKPHIDEYIREDLLHLSEAGIEACAAEVARFISEGED